MTKQHKIISGFSSHDFIQVGQFFLFIYIFLTYLPQVTVAEAARRAASADERARRLASELSEEERLDEILNLHSDLSPDELAQRQTHLYWTDKVQKGRFPRTLEARTHRVPPCSWVGPPKQLTFFFAFIVFV